MRARLSIALSESDGADEIHDIEGESLDGLKYAARRIVMRETGHAPKHSRWALDTKVRDKIIWGNGDSSTPYLLKLEIIER